MLKGLWIDGISAQVPQGNVNGLQSVCMSAEWLAHENAVFDIAWVPGEPQLVGPHHSESESPAEINIF